MIVITIRYINLCIANEFNFIQKLKLILNKINNH